MACVYVSQLRFARSEFERCLAGVAAEDALRQIAPMNCLSWIVGHTANQEHRYCVVRAQGKDLAPGLNDLVGCGSPKSTPPWDEMVSLWHRIVAAEDVCLDCLTPELLRDELYLEGRPPQNIGGLLLRNVYHYWFHLGEAHAIRQVLGHSNLPQFVGDMSSVAF